MFAAGKGTPLDAQNIVNRHLKPLLKGAGLPDIRWYDLGHTCAILLLDKGVRDESTERLVANAWGREDHPGMRAPLAHYLRDSKSLMLAVTSTRPSVAANSS